MLYFIAYVLDGEAGRYHTELTRTLSERFGIAPLHERMPPHLTLKAPFEADDVSDVGSELESFSRSTTSAPLQLRGFGAFGNRVVFLNVLSSRKAEAAANALTRSLRALPTVTFGRREKTLPFHASVARFLSLSQFRDVWEYVQGLEEPRFDLSFNHVALLEKPGKRWEVKTVYPFR